jgi:hypothetical protein
MNGATLALCAIHLRVVEVLTRGGSPPSPIPTLKGLMALQKWLPIS